MGKIAAQIAANETAASVADVATLLSPDSLVLVGEIENELLTAERFSKPRTSIGRAKIPGKNTALERLILRIHRLIFRDQRNTDAALVAAVRKLLQLQVRQAAWNAHAAKTLTERTDIADRGDAAT